MAGENVFEFLRGDLDPAADDELLEPADEAVITETIPRRDLEQIAGVKEAVRSERGGGELGRLEVAVEYRGPADLHLARVSGFVDLDPRVRIDDTGLDGPGRALRPFELGSSEARKEASPSFRIGRLLNAGGERHALIRAEHVHDLDAESIMESANHRGVERRRSRADAPEAREVGAREQRLILQQHVEDRGWRDGVVRTLGGDLREVNRQVEGMMENQRARGMEPAHEAPSDGRHVHERKRIQQDVAPPYTRAFEVGVTDRVPVIVRPGDALGHAFGARGPADGRDVVGGHGLLFKPGSQTLEVMARAGHGREGRSSRWRIVAQNEDAGGG